MGVIEMIIFGGFLTFATFLGYKFGKGEPIDIIPQKLKAIIRTEEQEAILEQQLKQRKH